MISGKKQIHPILFCLLIILIGQFNCYFSVKVFLTLLKCVKYCSLQRFLQFFLGNIFSCIWIWLVEISNFTNFFFLEKTFQNLRRHAKIWKEGWNTRSHCLQPGILARLVVCAWTVPSTRPSSHRLTAMSTCRPSRGWQGRYWGHGFVLEAWPWLLALNPLSLNVLGYIRREMCISGTIHSQDGVIMLKSCRSQLLRNSQ